MDFRDIFIVWSLNFFVFSSCSFSKRGKKLVELCFLFSISYFWSCCRWNFVCGSCGDFFFD